MKGRLTRKKKWVGNAWLQVKVDPREEAQWGDVHARNSKPRKAEGLKQLWFQESYFGNAGGSKKLKTENDKFLHGLAQKLHTWEGKYYGIV